MSLHVYGCSFVLSGNQLSGYFDRNTFGHIVAEKFKLDCNINGIPGSSNHIIFSEILKNLSSIRSTASLIYVNWSFTDRLTIANQSIYHPVLPTDAFLDNPTLSESISKKDVENLYRYTYDENLCFEELLAYNAALMSLLQDVRFVFTVTNMRRHEIEVAPHLLGILQSLPGYINLDIYELILSDNRYATSCRHLTKEGHEIFAELLFDAIAVKFY
jgi:hypothetical protein